MKFEISFDSSEIISVDKKFKGQLRDGHRFEILANWNSWDDWSVDDILFENDFEGMDEMRSMISDEFLSEMNG
jgi:hypothetical protein